MKKILVKDCEGFTINTGKEALTITNIQQIGGGLMIVDFSDNTSTPPIPNNTYITKAQIISEN